MNRNYGDLTQQSTGTKIYLIFDLILQIYQCYSPTSWLSHALVLPTSLFIPRPCFPHVLSLPCPCFPHVLVFPTSPLSYALVFLTSSLAALRHPCLFHELLDCLTPPLVVLPPSVKEEQHTEGLRGKGCF